MIKSRQEIFIIIEKVKGAIVATEKMFDELEDLLDKNPILCDVNRSVVVVAVVLVVGVAAPPPGVVNS